MLSSRLQRLNLIVSRFLRRGAFESIVKLTAKYRPAEMASCFINITHHERLQLLELCADDEYKAALLSELELDIASELVESLEAKRAAELLQKVDPDDAADIIGELAEERQVQILELMREDEHLEELLRYDDSTAGGIMNPQFFALHRDTKVEEAIEALRQAEKVEMAFYLYVINDEQKLVGVISLRQLVTSKPHVPLAEIMNSDVVSVHPEMDQEEVARLSSRYGFLALPVVDEAGRILGIVTIDDVIDVLKEEATEDILKMAGAGHALMGSHTFGTSFKARLPWLLASAVGGLVAAMIIGYYEKTLNQVVALAAFIPVVLGMGGNVGTQSASIVIRGLATGRIQIRQLWIVLGREILVGLLLGVVYGVAIGAFGFVKALNSGFDNALLLGAVVGISVLGSMFLAAAMATSFPLLFERLHIDPAVAAGPFVTTSVDILGIFVYFMVAKLLLSI